MMVELVEREKMTVSIPTLILVPKTDSGFFTALCLKSYLKSFVNTEVSIVEVVPCQLKRVVISEKMAAIYVGDLGHKNCDTAAIVKLFKKYSEKIVFWADNHPENDQISELKGKANYFPAPLTAHPSCAALLNKLWGNKIVKPEWVVAANYFEDQSRPSNNLVDEYKKIKEIGKMYDLREHPDGSSTINLDKLKKTYLEYVLYGSYKETISSMIEMHDKKAATQVA